MCSLHGVEAVVDKDLTACELGLALDVEMLFLLTDVAGIDVNWQTLSARRIKRVSPRHLGALQFESGTMAPKVLAACRFAELTGRPAHIGRLEDAAVIVEGLAGTTVSRLVEHEMTFW